ncbi:MAG: DUF3146 domain-containing protein, partial [Microcystis aeruginosa]
MSGGNRPESTAYVRIIKQSWQTG